MSTELIIFDLDGTLVDTSTDIKEALNYCLRKRGIKEFREEEVKKIIGEGVRKFIEKVIQLRSLSNDIYEELLECFVSYYSEHISVFSKPYPGVKETLEKLNHIKKAVISNKLTTLSVRTLSSLGLLRFFDFVAGNDYFSEQKPSPLPIIKTLERFGINRENAIIVGDSNFDILAGKSAGIKTVAVTYGYKDRDILKDADYIIDRFEDLLRIIGDSRR